MDPSNSILIHAALNGDQQAYKESSTDFTENFCPGFAHGEKPPEAEDLTRRFYQSLQFLATFNSEYAFSTWLYKIAANPALIISQKTAAHLSSGQSDHHAGSEIQRNTRISKSPNLTIG